MVPNFQELLRTSDHLIVISIMDDGNIGMAYSDGLDEMQVLDALSFVTSEWYGMAEEGPSHPHELKGNKDD